MVIKFVSFAFEEHNTLRLFDWSPDKKEATFSFVTEWYYRQLPDLLLINISQELHHRCFVVFNYLMSEVVWWQTIISNTHQEEM